MAINGLSFLNQMNRTNRTMSDSMRKISSGTKYPSASYGPSDYAIQVRMQTNIRTANQSKSNTQTANAMLSTAMGGVDSTVNALTSIREQILRAANGTNTPGDVSTIANNINQQVSTIDENSQIQFNGMTLLDGSRSVTVAGDNGYKTIQLGNLSAEGLGLVDHQGNSTLDLNSSSGIASALDTVDAALEKATNMATDIGSVQQNLSFSEDNYSTSIASLTQSESTEGDVNIAEEVTKLKSADVQNQLAMFAAKMNMHNNAAVLSLLK